MTVIRKAALARYSDQEKHVLLSGTPLSPMSTRFGHPKHGWRIGEIRKAWLHLGDELMKAWNTPEYAAYRARYSLPFAQRILEEHQ